MKRLKCQHSYCSECVHRGCRRSPPPPQPPLILKRMTTVIAWHITASHKALGSLCVRRRQAGRKPRLALALSVARLWMWDASVVRRKKPQSGWFSGKRYNIYSWHSGGSWLAARGVTRSWYFKTFLSRSQLSSFCNPPFLFFFCYPRWDWCCRFCPGFSKNVRRASFRSRNHKVGVIECRFAVFG